MGGVYHRTYVLVKVRDSVGRGGMIKGARQAGEKVLVNGSGVSPPVPPVRWARYWPGLVVTEVSIFHDIWHMTKRP